MKTSELLTKARERIATPDKWKKHTYAVDATGMPVSPIAPEACRFCAYGALYAALGEPKTLMGHDWNAPGASYLSDAVRSKHGSRFDLEFVDRVHVAGFNDSCNHTEILEVYDLAIELAKADEAWPEDQA